MKLNLSAALSTSVMAILMAGPVLAQDGATESTGDAVTETAPPDLELEAAERAAKLAEFEGRIIAVEKAAALADAEIAEAKAKSAVAGLPSSTTVGVDGKIVADEKAGYFAEVLAYEALDSVSEELIGELGNLSTSSVVLVDTLDMASLADKHALIEIQTKSMIESLDRLSRNSVIDTAAGPSDDNYFYNDIMGKAEFAGLGAIIGAIPGILGVGRDIGKFFQTEVTLSGRDITILDSALKTVVSGYLKKHSVTVYFPKSDLSRARGVSSQKCGPDSDISSTNATGVTIVTLQAPAATTADRFLRLNCYRNLIAQKRYNIKANAQAAQSFGASEIAKATQEIAQINKRIADIQARDPKPANINTLIANEETQLLAPTLLLATMPDKVKKFTATEVYLLGEIDKAIAAADAILAASVKPGEDGVTPLERVAVIDRIISKQNTKLLYLTVLNTGAELQMTKKAFSGNIGYIGGVTVGYTLLDGSGELIAAGQKTNVNTKLAKRGKPLDCLKRPETTKESLSCGRRK